MQTYIQSTCMLQIYNKPEFLFCQKLYKYKYMQVKGHGMVNYGTRNRAICNVKNSIYGKEEWYKFSLVKQGKIFQDYHYFPFFCSFPSPDFMEKIIKVKKLPVKNLPVKKEML